MRIGIDIDHEEFIRLREELRKGSKGPEELRILAIKFGKELLIAIQNEKMTPNWHCTNCKNDFGSVGEMKSCPKCFTNTLEYIGPPRIGHEIKVKATRLPEAGRSQMTGGGNNNTHPMFKLCPEDHHSSYEYKEERSGYHLYFCGTCNAIKARKRKILETVQ